MVNICVPVLKRYDLLNRMIITLEDSTVKIDHVWVIDNGRNADMMNKIIRRSRQAIGVYTPSVAMGVAESWNWFIRNIHEERIITNDDIIFEQDSVARLLEPKADLIWAAGCGFSCFVIRDACVEKLGTFDEEISPGYAYYEDDDYLQRLNGRGTREASADAVTVDANVRHEHSATLKASTEEEIAEHHRKFKIAQTNYAKKWGLEKEFALIEMVK